MIENYRFRRAWAYNTAFKCPLPVGIEVTLKNYRRSVYVDVTKSILSTNSNFPLEASISIELF